MGFTPSQIGKRRKFLKLKMENNLVNEFRCIEAEIKPAMTIMRGNQLTLGLEPHSNYFFTFPFVFSITREENLKNEVLQHPRFTVKDGKVLKITSSSFKKTSRYPTVRFNNPFPCLFKFKNENVRRGDPASS
jgi:hypothetical protein